MATTKNPAPRAAGRARDAFESLTASNSLPVPQSLTTVQAAHLARRLGLSVAVARIVAQAFTIVGGRS